MIYHGIDTTSMTAWEAIQFLDGNLASGDDPVRFRGEDMTAFEVGYKIRDQNDMPAEKCRLTYYGGAPTESRLIVGGTLKKMVENRIELKMIHREDPHSDLATPQLREEVEKKYWRILNRIRAANRIGLTRLNATLDKIK